MMDQSYGLVLWDPAASADVYDVRPVVQWTGVMNPVDSTVSLSSTA